MCCIKGYIAYFEENWQWISIVLLINAILNTICIEFCLSQSKRARYGEEECFK